MGAERHCQYGQLADGIHAASIHRTVEAREYRCSLADKFCETRQRPAKLEIGRNIDHNARSGFADHVLLEVRGLGRVHEECMFTQHSQRLQ